MTETRRLPRDFAAPDERELKKLREMAPHRQIKDWRFWIAEHLHRYPRLSDTVCPSGPWCVYCGRRASTTRMAVNPITLQRNRYELCKRPACANRLRDWEGMADARRRRAQYDWERENPTVAAAAMVSEIPPQYPSVSRATLRAFLDSGRDMATLATTGRWTVTALNGSIKRLGFADQVFAEVRSGQAVLRRTPDGAS